MDSKKWIWFNRNVEGHVKEALSKPYSIILVRGQRRVGKSSVVRFCLEAQERDIIC